MVRPMTPAPPREKCRFCLAGRPCPVHGEKKHSWNMGGNGSLVAEILIVEDDRGLVDVMQEALTAGGFLVRVASSGEEGVRRFQEQGADLVIMDLMLPGMDGWEAIEAIRKSPGGQGVPILVLTSVEQRVDSETLRSWGATGYFQKPFPPRDFVRRIRQLTNTHGRPGRQ